MTQTLPVPRRIAILAHGSIPGAVTEAEAMARFLQELAGQPVAWGALHDAALEQRLQDGEFDLLIALGGDGTVLRAGTIGAPLGVPILGINYGHFGFLTEIQRDQWRAMLPKLIHGNYRLEERMMLLAEHRRAGQVLAHWPVINEVVVCRGHFVRPIQVHTEVNGYRLYNFVADGVIAATATGSTAYALAAGGPIMPPEMRNILIIPVAPHLSMDRAIILSQGTDVIMRVHTTHEAVMSVDGHAPEPMEDGDEVRVSANQASVQFVRFQDPSYFYRNITAYMEHNPLTGITK